MRRSPATSQPKRATRDIPEATRDIPEAARDIPEAARDIPEAARDVPNHTPEEIAFDSWTKHFSRGASRRHPTTAKSTP